MTQLFSSFSQLSLCPHPIVSGKQLMIGTVQQNSITGIDTSRQSPKDHRNGTTVPSTPTQSITCFSLLLFHPRHTVHCYPSYMGGVATQKWLVCCCWCSFLVHCCFPSPSHYLLGVGWLLDCCGDTIQYKWTSHPSSSFQPCWLSCTCFKLILVCVPFAIVIVICPHHGPRHAISSSDSRMMMDLATVQYLYLMVCDINTYYYFFSVFSTILVPLFFVSSLSPSFSSSPYATTIVCRHYLTTYSTVQLP